MKKTLVIFSMLLVLLLAGCDGGQAAQDSPSPAVTSPAASPTSTEPSEEQPSENEPDAASPSPTISDPVPLDSIYSELSDEQFALLTELVAKSFYSFTLDDSDYLAAEDDPKVMDCLMYIFDYAYNNYFELDPDYSTLFAAKYDLVSNIGSYDLLCDRFMVGHYRDNEKGKWIDTIHSYSLNPDDVIKDDSGFYIDAEGYLNKNVAVYWEEDGKMEEAGKIVDIASNCEINGVTYAYALNVEFSFDPDASGWRDGENFLTFNKKLCGKPAYYVNALDPNRSIKKETIDYSGNIQWKPLDEHNAKNDTEVYFGAASSKAFWFTILDVNPAQDTMTVKYPSGSIESKSFSAMVNQNYLYIR